MNISLDSSDVIPVIILLVLLFLSAFFSSAETAMTTVNRIRIPQPLLMMAMRRAKTLLKITDDPAKFLSAILIGNNIVNLSAASLTTSLAYGAGRFYGSNCQRYPYPCCPALRRDYTKDHGHDTSEKISLLLGPGFISIFNRL